VELAMKINKISIKNLFGIFNHEIPLNTKEHITIIHGPNGYGKTILLTLVNGIFNSQYHELRKIPFSELSIRFDTGSSLSFKKEPPFQEEENKKSKHDNPLNIVYSVPGEKPKVFLLETLGLKNLPFSLNLIERRIKGLRRVEPEVWLYLPTGEQLLLDEVLNRFGNQLSTNLKIKHEPAWLKEIQNSININFIKTQRLINIAESRYRYDYEESPSVTPVVLNYAEELAAAIQKKLAEYGSLSQSLDRTFPTRLVKDKREDEPTIGKLKNELKELEEKRSQLMDAGLLDKEKEIDFKDLHKIDDSKINVLSVYIEDAKKKLMVFNELSDKIDKMVKITNSRFLFKKLSISKDDGFEFKTSGDKILPLTNLSSGEQHELVLLYEMLFKVQPNSLILIDEPELSLHIHWQQQFLIDLQEITELVGFDVLIATHSPQIINNRWDLTVELKGPQE
jgi:predicted ATP-binding protein involved in virulence